MIQKTDQNCIPEWFQLQLLSITLGKPFNLCAFVSLSVKSLYYPPYPLDYEILCNMFRIVPIVCTTQMAAT